MNTHPIIKHNGIERPVGSPGCGRAAVENDAIAFWQSRSTRAGGRAEPFVPTDLRALARQIRAAYR